MSRDHGVEVELERLSYGLQTGFWNPGTFSNGSLVGGSFPDPLCNSAELGGTPGVNELTDPSGYFTDGNACRGNLALQRTTVPEQTLMTGMAVFSKDFDAGGIE